MVESYINDVRSASDFKTMTFSRYKKTAVKRELLQCLGAKKVEAACYWSAELVCSGHFSDLWDCIINFLTKNIRLANPRLPIYLLLRFDNFKKIIENGYGNDELRLRNNSGIRRMFGEIIATLCYSATKHSVEAIKVNRIDGFNMTSMACRFRAPHVDFGRECFKSDDPCELYVATNELAFHIGKDMCNTVDACYWVEWVIEYDAACRKRREKCSAERRVFARVQDKYQKDIIWIVWDAIITETKRRSDPLTSKIIDSLLGLYCIRYTTISMRKRRFVIYLAISILTESFDRKREIVLDMNKVNQIAESIDSVYRDVKKKEQAPNTGYLNDSGSRTNHDRTVERLAKMNEFLHGDGLKDLASL